MGNNIMDAWIKYNAVIWGADMSALAIKVKKHTLSYVGNAALYWTNITGY